MGKQSQTKLTKTDEEGNTVPDLDTDGSQKIGWSAASYYFHEAINVEDQASVKKYGGYYIGRYEAGDGTVTNLSTPRLRTESDKGDTQTNTVTIKKGQAPYNWVTQAECVTLSNGITAANGYNTSKMYTKLCSSYAWDTALKFIGVEYATNSIQGNYHDTTFSYKDITGANQTKNNETYTLIPTGQTTAVKNIYDMGGNVWEYTSESSSDENTHFVGRGGDCSYKASGGASGNRGGSYGSANSFGAFRSTLYLK